MINLALFGAGRIGKIHGHNAARHPNARITALHDPYAPNAEALSQQLGCAQKTAADIFSDDAIDAVLICSATDTHSDLIEQALASNKHIFCEKPIDLDIARVKEVVKKVEACDLIAMVAFNRRFDPDFAALKNRLEEGAIGDVEMLSVISKDPAPPPLDYIKVSGGLFRDMTIHDFDMVRFLLGEDIVSVSAQASCLVDDQIGQVGDVDSALISLRTASGKLAQISNSRRASFGYDQRFEVHGSQGMLCVANQDENKLALHTAASVQTAKPLLFFLERYTQAYQAELNAFIEAIKQPNTFNDLPSMRDGLIALELAEAALTSVASKQTIMLS